MGSWFFFGITVFLRNLYILHIYGLTGLSRRPHYGYYLLSTRHRTFIHFSRLDGINRISQCRERHTRGQRSDPHRQSTSDWLIDWLMIDSQPNLTNNRMWIDRTWFAKQSRADWPDWPDQTKRCDEQASKQASKQQTINNQVINRIQTTYLSK